MGVKTTDVSDKYGEQVQVAECIFRNYGGKRTFEGKIATLKVEDDNLLVHEALSEDGTGRILVIDGGGSVRTALVGDKLSARALEHGWVGIIIYGGMRDSKEVGELPIGLKALNTAPRRSAKNRVGQRDVDVTFAGVTFKPGKYVYADEDGIVVADKPLQMP